MDMSCFPDGLKEFLSIFAVGECRYWDGRPALLMFKAVTGDRNCWSYRHRVRHKSPYAKGTLVKCRTVEEDGSILCGAGLHVCPTKEVAQLWTGGRYLIDGFASVVIKVAVLPENIVPPPAGLRSFVLTPDQRAVLGARISIHDDIRARKLRCSELYVLN